MTAMAQPHPPANAWAQVSLRVPTWLGNTETLPLPLWRAAYKIAHTDDLWTLRIVHGGMLVYQGIGPIELVDEPLPF